MLIKSVVRMALIFSFLAVPFQAFSGQGYTVTLVNGNTLSANSYTIEGDKINLRFPVGEAGFSLSEVTSIKDEAGNDMLFQEKGVYVPSAPEEAKDGREETDYGYAGADEFETVRHAGTTTEASTASQAQASRGTDVQRKWERVYYSAQAEEIDSFIDAVFEAEERGEEISEEEYDRAFSAFFEEDEDTTSDQIGGW